VRREENVGKTDDGMADEQRAVRRSTGKGTTFEERAKDREFLLFFFSLSTLRERDFLKRGGSRDG
jgi:hypothetical protein